MVFQFLLNIFLCIVVSIVTILVIGVIVPVYRFLSRADKLFYFYAKYEHLLSDKFLKTDKIQEYIKGSSTGSAMPAMKHSTIGKIKFVVPDEKNIHVFEKVLNEFERIIINNNHENKRLMLIRDTLLPKLMNGEV